jgi:L-threonylcarbamoyladenylate synthase
VTGQVQILRGEEGVEEASRRLINGECVALPTETVYGLAADAGNPAAVKAIFTAKGRPTDHPLIVHLASAAQLPEWASEVPNSAWQLTEAFWPGPLTLLLHKKSTVTPKQSL